MLTAHLSKIHKFKAGLVQWTGTSALQGLSSYHQRRWSCQAIFCAAVKISDPQSRWIATRLPSPPTGSDWRSIAVIGFCLHHLMGSNQLAKDSVLNWRLFGAWLARRLSRRPLTLLGVLKWRDQDRGSLFSLRALFCLIWNWAERGSPSLLSRYHSPSPRRRFLSNKNLGRSSHALS